MPTPSSLRLTLSADIQPERLAAMTRELADDLARAGTGARMAERETKPGERSGGPELLSIALGMLSHSMAILAAEYILSRVQRHDKVTVKIETADGRHVATVDASARDAKTLAAHLTSEPPPSA